MSPLWTRNDTLSFFVPLRLEMPRSGNDASDAALIGIPVTESGDGVSSSPLRSADWSASGGSAVTAAACARWRLGGTGIPAFGPCTNRSKSAGRFDSETVTTEPAGGAWMRYASTSPALGM